MAAKYGPPVYLRKKKFVVKTSFFYLYQVRQLISRMDHSSFTSPIVQTCKHVLACYVSVLLKTTTCAKLVDAAHCIYINWFYDAYMLPYLTIKNLIN